MQGKMSHPHRQAFKSNVPAISCAQKPTSNAQLKQATLAVSGKCMQHSSTLPPLYFKESEKFIPPSSFKKSPMVSAQSSHQKTNFPSTTKNQTAESLSISSNCLFASEPNSISSKQSARTPVHAVKASLNTSPKLPGLINSCQFINFTPSRASASLTSDKQNHVPEKTANQTQLDNSHIIQNIPVKNPQIKIDLKMHTLESAVPCTDGEVSTPLNKSQAMGVKRPYRVKKSKNVDSKQFSPEKKFRRTKRSTAGLRPKRYSVSIFESEGKKEEKFSQMNKKLCKNVKGIKEAKQCSPAKKSREDKILPNKTVSLNSPLAYTSISEPSPPTCPKSKNSKGNNQQSVQPSNQTVKSSKIQKSEPDITKFAGEKLALFATPSPQINLPSQVKGKRIGKNYKVYVLPYSSTDKSKPIKMLGVEKMNGISLSTNTTCFTSNTLDDEYLHPVKCKNDATEKSQPTNSPLYNSARNYTKSSKERQELSSNSNVPIAIKNSPTKTPTEKSKTAYLKVITPVILNSCTLNTYQEKMELSEDSTCKPNVFDSTLSNNTSIMCRQLVGNAPVEVSENSSLELPKDYSVPSSLDVNQKVTMHKQKQVSNSELCNEKASGIPHITKGNEELVGILEAVQKFSSSDGPNEKQEACISSTPDDIRKKLPELVMGVSKTKKNMDSPINGDRTSVSSSTDLNLSSAEEGKLNKNIKPPSFSQALKQFATSTSGDTESTPTQLLPSVKIPKAPTALVNSTKDSEGCNQQSGQPSSQTVKGSKIQKPELDIAKFAGEKIALFAAPSTPINLPSQVKGRHIGKNDKVYILRYSSTDKNKPSKILDIEKMNVIPLSINTACLTSNSLVQDCTMTKINESNSCNTSEDKIELSPKESLAPEAHSNQNSQVASKCAMKRKSTDSYLTPHMRTYSNVPKRRRKLSDVKNCTGLKEDNLLCSNAIKTESTISTISQNLQCQEKRDLAMEVETSQSATIKPEVELPVPSASTVKQVAQWDSSTQMHAYLSDSCIQTLVEQMCDSNPSSQESLHANLLQVSDKENSRQMLLQPDLIADRKFLKHQVNFGMLTVKHLSRKPEEQSTDHSLANAHLVNGPLETWVECTHADHEKTIEHKTEIAKQVGKASPKRTITVWKDSRQSVSHLKGKMSHPHRQVFKSNEPPISSAQKSTSNAQLKQAPLDVSEKCMQHSSTLPPVYFKGNEKFISPSSFKKLIVVSAPSSHQKTNFLSATKNQSVESPSISSNLLLASKPNSISSKQSVRTPVHAVKASLSTSPKLPGLTNSCQFINFTPSRASAYLTSDKQNHVPGKKTANQTQLDNSDIIQSIPVKNPQIEIDLKTHTLVSGVQFTDEEVPTSLNINQAMGIKRPYRVKKSQSVDSNQFSTEENCRRTKRSTAGLRPKRYSVSPFESEDKKEEEFSQMNVRLCKDVKGIKGAKQCSPAKESCTDKTLPNKTVSGNSLLACANTCKPSPPTRPKSPKVKYNEEYKTSIFQKRYHISPPSTSHVKEKLTRGTDKEVSTPLNINQATGIKRPYDAKKSQSVDSNQLSPEINCRRLKRSTAGLRPKRYSISTFESGDKKENFLQINLNLCKDVKEIKEAKQCSPRKESHEDKILSNKAVSGNSPLACTNTRKPSPPARPKSSEVNCNEKYKTSLFSRQKLFHLYPPKTSHLKEKLRAIMLKSREDQEM